MAVEQKSEASLWKIGDVARKIGTTTRSLRFYEEEGLVKTFRNNKGTRLYDNEDIKRFEAILHLSRVGIPLQEMKRLVCARPESKTGNESSRKVYVQLEELLFQMEEKIRECTEMKSQIMRAEAAVQQCFGCRKRPTRTACDKCPVGIHLENSRLLYLVWDQP